MRCRISQFRSGTYPVPGSPRSQIEVGFPVRFRGPDIPPVGLRLRISGLQERGKDV